MKKILTTTLATLILCIIVVSQEQPPYPTAYDGPYDNTYWTGWNWHSYDSMSSFTTLGSLAHNSDIIGVGIVSGLADDHFTVTVDHALVGCTNGAAIVVWEDPKTLRTHYPFNTKADYMPTNDSRIVFSVYTNEHGGGIRVYWSLPENEVPYYPPVQILTRYQLRWCIPPTLDPRQP